MILGAVHRSNGHLPYSREKPQKPSARRPSDEGAVQPVIASNGVPFLQRRWVGSNSTSGREKEGNKERTGHGSIPHCNPPKWCKSLKWDTLSPLAPEKQGPNVESGKGPALVHILIRFILKQTSNNK